MASARGARTLGRAPVIFTLGLMSNSREGSQGGDGTQVLLVLFGMLSALFGGFLVIAGIVQWVEYPQLFMSAHGGTLQLLILGVPLLVGGVAAFRAAARRAQKRSEHET